MAKAFMIHGTLREPFASMEDIASLSLDAVFYFDTHRRCYEKFLREVALRPDAPWLPRGRRDRRLPSMALFWWKPAQFRPSEP